MGICNECKAKTFEVKIPLTKEHKQKVNDFIKPNEIWTQKDIREFCELTQPIASRALKTLVNEGVIYEFRNEETGRIKFYTKL